MFFGTPVWPLDWQYPYDKTIERIHKLGFKGVELIGWDAESFKSYYTPETCTHLKKMIADFGMVLTNFSHTPSQLASEDKTKRQEAMDTYKRAVETAQRLGSKNITSITPYPFSMTDGYDGKAEFMAIRHIPTVQIFTVDADLERDFDANYNLFIEQIKWCCDLAGQAGLKVLLEPHPYRYVNSASSMLRVIDKTGADNLGMNFDPSHLFPSGDMPQITVRQLGSRIGHTHFSDNDSYTNAHWRPGKGKIDWFAVMQALKSVGYDDVISLELEDVPGAATPVESIAAGLIDSMDIELKLSVDYITNICKALDIKLD